MDIIELTRIDKFEGHYGGVVGVVYKADLSAQPSPAPTSTLAAEIDMSYNLAGFATDLSDDDEYDSTTTFYVTSYTTVFVTIPGPSPT